MKNYLQDSLEHIKEPTIKNLKQNSCLQHMEVEIKKDTAHA